MSATTKPPRLEGLDIARFIAFVGMVIVNFNIVMGVQHDLNGLGTMAVMLEGRAAATFVVLAGIGLGLAAQHSGGKTIAVTLKRALFLLVLGLLNALIFSADILHYYAAYFVFGALLLSLRTPWLIGALLTTTLGFVALCIIFTYETGWNWQDFSYADFWMPEGFFRNLFFNGWHPVFPWLGFLIFGLILARIDLAATKTQIFMIVVGFFALAAAEAVRILLTEPLNAISPELIDFLSTSPVPPMPLYVVAGMGAASLVIGLCLWGSNWLKQSGLMRIFAPAGRQTLTLYVAHIILGMGTLEALGLLENQTGTNALIASVIFSAIAVIYAFIWNQFFKRGPLELLMRKLAG